MTETVTTFFNTQLNNQSWIIQIGIIFLITLVISAVVKAYLNRLSKRQADLESRRWYDILVNAVSAPVQLLIWLISISFMLEAAQRGLALELLPSLDPFRKLMILLGIGWSMLRLVSGGEDHVLLSSTQSEKEVDRTTVIAVAKLLRLCVFVLTLLVVLQTLGFSISGVLAFGGISGIAIGFAAKDLLANFFGGLMIFLDRPFNVGDAVRSPDQNIEGVVEHIGWRLTRMRTFDKRPLFVPNSIFLNISVENISRMSHRRIREHIGIRYDDAQQMRTIVEQVKEMLLAHDGLDKSQAILVNFDTFSASSMDFLMQAFTNTTDLLTYHKIREDILLKTLDIIEANNAECAFPTSTLHIQSHHIDQQITTPNH